MLPAIADDGVDGKLQMEPISGILISSMAGWITAKLSDRAARTVTSSMSRAAGIEPGTPVGRALIRAVREGIRGATESAYGNDTDTDRAQHAADSLLEARSDTRLPLVDGTGVEDLPHTVRNWIGEAFLPPIGSLSPDPDPLSEFDDHELMVPLVTEIVDRIRIEATRGDGLLQPLWHEFCISALASQVNEHRALAHTEFSVADKPNGFSQIGLVPILADQRVSRIIDQELEGLVSRGKSIVLTGMGGVGKTQLAASLVAQLRNEGAIDLSIWITATSRDQIIDGYAQAANKLLGVERDDLPSAANRFLVWLSSTARSWLIVLDDVQSPGDVRGLWPPASPHGRCVITTRRRDSAFRSENRSLIEVPIFDSTESIEYLSNRLADRDDPEHELVGLGADLGQLPLALAQASSYILDQDLSCREYREMFADESRKLQDLVPESESLPDDHTDPVSVTWRLSMQAASREEPEFLAIALLCVMSLLDPNGIPEAILAHEHARLHYACNISGTFSEDAALQISQADVTTMLRKLHKLGLITHDRRSGIVRIHSLMQRVMRDRNNAASLMLNGWGAANGLFGAWPHPEPVTDSLWIHRANAVALFSYTFDDLVTPAIHPLLNRFGDSYVATGQYSTALEHFQMVLNRIPKSHQRTNPGALTVRGNLARMLGATGNPTGAEAELRSLLADMEEVLETDHPYILTTRFNLARFRARNGDTSGAIIDLRQLLSDQIRLSGIADTNVLSIQHQLASCLGTAGDPEQAVAEIEKLLPDSTRILGAGYPDTLSFRAELAHWRGESGHYTQAIDDLLLLIPDMIEHLGAEHVFPLNARLELSLWSGRAGKMAQATRDLAKVLPDMEVNLGLDHPSICIAASLASELANKWYKTQGSVEAIAFLANTIPVMDRTLGASHVETFAARQNLAGYRAHAGDRRSAIIDLVNLLSDMDHALGPEHSFTRIVRNNLIVFLTCADINLFETTYQSH